MNAAAIAVKGSRSVLAAATPETVDELRISAKNNDHVLAVTAPDLDSLFRCASHLRETGFHDILLQFQTSSLAEQFQTNSAIRRAALKDAVKPLGYPFLRFLRDTGDVLDNRCRSNHRDRQIRRHLCSARLRPGPYGHTHDATSQYLHRSPEADPGGAESLSHRRTRVPTLRFS